MDTAEACRGAIEAGNDMVLISHTPATQERTWDALIGAARSSPAFRAMLKEAVRRILLVKLRAFRASPGAASAPRPSVTNPRPLIPAPGAREFFAQVSARAVTLVSGERVPHRPGAREKVLLAGQFPEFISEGLKRYPGASTLLFPFLPFYSARPEDRAAVRAAAAASDTVIFCLANFNSLGVLKALKEMGRRVIVISALSPVYLSDVPWVKTAVAVYGDGKDSFRAGFAVLAGDFPASGVLPVDFGRLEPR